MSRSNDAELDFFSADDVAERADAFSELDPDRNRETLIFPLTGLLAVVAVALVAFALPPNPQGPTNKPKATHAKLAKAEDRPVAAASPPPPPAAFSPLATTESGTAAKAEERPERRRMMRRPPPPPVAPPAPVVVAAAVTAGPLVETPEVEAEPEAEAPWLSRALKKHAAEPSAPPAEVELEIAEAPAPTSPVLAKATQLIDAGRASEAIVDLETMPRDTAVLAVLGRAFYEAGRDRDALRVLLSARKAGEAGVHTLLLLGDLLHTRDNNGAREAYQAFLTHHPRSPHASEVAEILRNL